MQELGNEELIKDHMHILFGQKNFYETMVDA